jgi:catalase
MRERWHGAIAKAMSGVPAAIVERQLADFNKADRAYGAGVQKALK